MEHTPSKQEDFYMGEHGITRKFLAASDHPYSCTCHLCHMWWRLVGPDEDTGLYGPFRESLDE